MDSLLQFSSSIGLISIRWDVSERLTGIEIVPAEGQSSDARATGLPGQTSGPVPERILDAIEVIRRYLRTGHPFAESPWDLIETSDLTEFQLQVYRAATAIPHGQTRTYAWIANRIRKPFATRAVGQALRKNPFPILVPCHRVVAVNTLGGFMGVSDPEQPEMKLKSRLIELENSYANPLFSFAV